MMSLTELVSSGATLRVDAGGSLYSPQLWQVRSIKIYFSLEGLILGFHSFS